MLPKRQHRLSLSPDTLSLKRLCFNSQTCKILQNPREPFMHKSYTPRQADGSANAIAYSADGGKLAADHGLEL